jgi:hypothetical protein
MSPISVRAYLDMNVLWLLLCLPVDVPAALRSASSDNVLDVGVYGAVDFVWVLMGSIKDVCLQ